MKRIFVLMAVFFIGILFLPSANAQFIHENAFNLPMVGGDVTFMQNDTATNLYAEDFHAIAKNWIEQNFPSAKFNKDEEEDNHLQAMVYFKIDDQHIQAPLYYKGILNLKWKDQVIQIKLEDLSYTTGQPNGKSKKNSGSTQVSFQVKQQVRSGADRLYPNTWDSLNDYGHALLKDFKLNLHSVAQTML